ncbi:hypothetical protein VTO42DRAFT_7670 [Malbranchea cinnamomea]
MTSSRNNPAQIFPGRGVGFLTLGASLHNVLTRLKALPQSYPTIDLSYSASDPLHKPVLIELPENGLRLRFDGADQRLRLIEVLDFTKIPLVYKALDVVKGSPPPQGPTFRHVYNRLFGPSYPGEYIPPARGESHGVYILSYPGVAFSFPLLHSAWSEQRDFVSLMSSSAASPATSMAVFQGSSWADARRSLYTRQPQYPRSTALVGKNRDSVADEVEEVRVLGGGKVELRRRSSSSFWITLSETTPQDLIAELGPPDAIYKKLDRRIMIHGGQPPGSTKPIVSSEGLHPVDLDQSSENSATDDSDEDASTAPSKQTTECFYNYFNHGFDVLISHPTAPGPPFPGSESKGYFPPLSPSKLTVTKLLLHGNVPGSYPFNRHRRCRWVIDIGSQSQPLTSETPYPEISEHLKRVWKDSYSSPSEEASLQRAMVLNRGWGDTPGSSMELLGGWEENADSKHWDASSGNGMESLGNTELFGFPGLLFEVLKNGAVSCLTVY